LLDWIAKDAFGLAADDRELECARVSLPNDAFERVDQIGETLMRGFGFGPSPISIQGSRFVFGFRSRFHEHQNLMCAYSPKKANLKIRSHARLASRIPTQFTTMKATAYLSLEGFEGKAFDPFPRQVHDDYCLCW
jgi:hypothetical protein